MVRIPEQDPGEVAAAAAAAATAGALAKVAAAAEKKEAAEISVPVQDAFEEKAPRTSEESTRFFIRGCGSLGEHHLKDHFEQFGEVVEVEIVRDKKTQRPRGLAFVHIVPRKPEDGPKPSIDEVIDKITGVDSHNIKGTEIEVQEALPKPAEDDGDKEEGEGAAKTVVEEAPEPEVDPVAQATAQAQWQMHYLAMAINASVPDMAPGSMPPAGGKAAKGGKGQEGKGKSKGKDKAEGKGKGKRAKPY
mmetsp:Transcript_69440/g.122831  ORF Transcript_69440/g.122831 Transcript_69440/m.122831 type:complete len:247 (-) Transcript_69440:119-859(-)